MKRYREIRWDVIFVLSLFLILCLIVQKDEWDRLEAQRQEQLNNENQKVLEVKYISIGDKIFELPDLEDKTSEILKLIRYNYSGVSLVRAYYKEDCIVYEVTNSNLSYFKKDIKKEVWATKLAIDIQNIWDGFKIKINVLNNSNPEIILFTSNENGTEWSIYSDEENYYSLEEIWKILESK